MHDYSGCFSNDCIWNAYNLFAKKSVLNMFLFFTSCLGIQANKAKVCASSHLQKSVINVSINQCWYDFHISASNATSRNLRPWEKFWLILPSIWEYSSLQFARRCWKMSNMVSTFVIRLIKPSINLLKQNVFYIFNKQSLCCDSLTWEM